MVAFPGWVSPFELLLVAPALVFVVINVERRLSINHRALRSRYIPCLIQRAIVGGFVAAIAYFGITTLLLTIIDFRPGINVADIFERSISFWVMFGACVAVGYHIDKLSGERSRIDVTPLWGWSRSYTHLHPRAVPWADMFWPLQGIYDGIAAKIWHYRAILTTLELRPKGPATCQPGATPQVSAAESSRSPERAKHATIVGQESGASGLQHQAP